MLDLSRNALRSLAGLESLARLEVLNVYMNQISDGAELVRLQANGKLRTLDARLNPVTRSKFWRLFVLQSLPALQSLDAQQVMAAETRRAAARAQLAPTDLSDRAAAESSDASEGEAEGGDRALPAAPLRALPAGATASTSSAPIALSASFGSVQAGVARAGPDQNQHQLGSSTRSSGSVRSGASSSAKSSSRSSSNVSSVGSSSDKGETGNSVVVAATQAPQAAQATTAAATAAPATTSISSDEPLSPLDGVQLAEELNRAYDAVLASERSLSPSPSPSPTSLRSRSPSYAPSPSPQHQSTTSPLAEDGGEQAFEAHDLDGSLLKLLKFARHLEAPSSAQGWEMSMTELNECLVAVVACRKADKARAERDNAASLELARALEARTAERDALTAALASQRRELQRAEERAEGKPALEAASPEQLAAQRVPAMLLEAHNALIESNRALLAELDDTRARYRADEEQWGANFDRLRALYAAAKGQAHLP